MDIAAMSVAMAQTNVMQQAQVATMKNAMDVAQTQMQGVVDMMEKATAPSFGHNFDIRV